MFAEDRLFIQRLAVTVWFQSDKKDQRHVSEGTDANEMPEWREKGLDEEKKMGLSLHRET